MKIILSWRRHPYVARVSIFLIAVALIAGMVGCGGVEYDLTITSTIGGSVTTPDEGTFTYDEGTVVNLVATPDARYQFINWTGDVGTIADVNDASTTITMNGDYSITANFEPGPETDIVINEVMFTPTAGNDEWVELYNIGTSSVDIDNYELTDEDNSIYTIPTALPDVPVGSFVVIVFDGKGSGNDDYDFSDNKAVLHTPPGLVNVFEDDGDQCSLYTGSTHDNTTIVDFVAWGVAPGTDGDNAYNANIWYSGMYVEITKGAEVSQIEANESIGLYPGSSTNSLDNWVLYTEDETTPGAENLVPKTKYFIPYDGGQIASSTFCLAWYVVVNAAEYRLQVNDDPNFSSPEVDVTLSEPRYQSPTPFPAGLYYWRVKVKDYNGRESDWTRAIQVESVVLEEVITSLHASLINLGQAPHSISGNVTDLNGNPVNGVTITATRDVFSKSDVTDAGGTYNISDLSPGTYIVTPSKGNDEFNPIARVVTIVGADVGGIDFVRTGKTLGIAHQFQAKDTRMLCLEGCDENAPYPWDDSHPDTGGVHGRMYCVQTSISMMNSYYGGQISKDYISWHWRNSKGDPSPDRDLAHNRGWPPPPAADETDELSWALGVNVPVNVGKPVFANDPGGNDIQTWIENGRPIMARMDWHMRVIDGYRVQLGVNQIHLLDPAAAGAAWVPYATDPTVHYWVGPVNAPNVVSDRDDDNDGDADTRDDSDDDGYGANWGIVDFDERFRFPTEWDDSDSDNDCVVDKPDVREYVFNNAGDYSYRNPDMDDDKKRKEVDPDSDNKNNDGAVDGAEDENRNGKYEPPAETDNFESNDDNKAPGQETKDFGDAPDKPYPSELASDGARHSVFAFEWLGGDVNGELHSKQGGLDEFDDGVEIPGIIYTGETLKLKVTISTSGEPGRYDIKDPGKVMYLNAWIDWGGDGSWAQAEDHVVKGDKFTGAGTKSYDIEVPAVMYLQSICWARFRLDYGENVGYEGAAFYGEVEDYSIPRGKEVFLVGLEGASSPTTTYGTPMAEEVEVLRGFRDEYLLTKSVGGALVDLYYRVSPPMAEFITEHPSLKPVVRAVLVPAIAVSAAVVNTTSAEKTTIVGLFALVSVAVTVAVLAAKRRGRGPEYT